jgi:hypothetical protein
MTRKSPVPIAVPAISGFDVELASPVPTSQ